MKNITFYLIVLLCLISILNVSGADWTKWRGPNANSMSDETGWNPKALENNPNILWETNIGMGHSSFAIKGDRLYTVGEKEITTDRDTTTVEVVYCLNVKNGQEIWQYAFPARHVRWPGPASTPVLDVSSLFYMNRDGTIYCFDANKGNVRWRRDLVTENISSYTGWGFCNSPVIEGEILILNVAESGLALDKKTGKTIWASTSVPGWVASPTLFDYNGKRLAALITNRILNVVDIKTGEIQWSHPWNSDSDATMVGTTMLLVGNHRNPGSSLLDIKDGKPEEIWKSRNVRHTYQNPVIIDGYAYTFGYLRTNNIMPFVCFDMKTGDIKWNEILGDYNQQGALMAANGKLIILSVDGELIIAELSPEGFKPISRAQIFKLEPHRSYPDGEPHCCWTAPVLSNGKLFARTTYGNMVCIDMK